jgi:hypothetical protein
VALVVFQRGPRRRLCRRSSNLGFIARVFAGERLAPQSLDDSPGDFCEPRHFLGEERHCLAWLLSTRHLGVPLICEAEIVPQYVSLLDVGSKKGEIVLVKGVKGINAKWGKFSAGSADVLKGVPYHLGAYKLRGFFVANLALDEMPVDSLEVGLKRGHDILVGIAQQPEAQFWAVSVLGELDLKLDQLAFAAKVDI